LAYKPLMAEAIGKARPDARMYEYEDLKGFGAQGNFNFDRDDEGFCERAREEGFPVAAKETIECLDFVSPGVYNARLQDIWERYKEGGEPLHHEEEETIRLKYTINEMVGGVEQFRSQDWVTISTIATLVRRHFTQNPAVDPYRTFLKEDLGIEVGEELAELHLAAICNPMCLGIELDQDGWAHWIVADPDVPHDEIRLVILGEDATEEEHTVGIQQKGRALAAVTDCKPGFYEYLNLVAEKKLQKKITF